MVNCKVEENRLGHLTVTFEDNSSVYLQSDWNRAQFTVDCLLVSPPDDWDGIPSKLPDKWWEQDYEDITKCPYQWHELAKSQLVKT